MTATVHPVALPPAAAHLLRIGVLTPHNPLDRQAFSGTVHHAVRALERRTDLQVRVLGPHRPVSMLDRLLRRPSPRVGPAMLADDGHDFDGLDAVVGLVASPLLDRAAALTDRPFLHVTDATPGFLREVYGRDVPATADRCEARVLARATTVYSSRMMADRARAEFGAAAGPIRHQPFGVNLDAAPDTLPAKAPLDRLELLFVGGDWARKGGDIALDALDALRAAGQAARLTLVGKVPAEAALRLANRTDIVRTGFLDKNRPRDAARLAALYARAHLMLLPTRADCTPMVVAEALAHGTPVLASDVGAVGEMIGSGAGRILAPGAGGAAWAREIVAMTGDATTYALLSDAAVERGRHRLNWDVWAEGIAVLAGEAALPGQRRAA